LLQQKLLGFSATAARAVVADIAAAAGVAAADTAGIAGAAAGIATPAPPRPQSHGPFAAHTQRSNCSLRMREADSRPSSCCSPSRLLRAGTPMPTELQPAVTPPAAAPPATAGSARRSGAPPVSMSAPLAVG